jgi:hypothetical protein
MQSKGHNYENMNSNMKTQHRLRENKTIIINVWWPLGIREEEKE